MTTALASAPAIAVDKPFQAAFADSPSAYPIPSVQQKVSAEYTRLSQFKQQQQQQQYSFPAMDVIRTPARQPSDPEKAALQTMDDRDRNDDFMPYQQRIDVNEIFIPSPYDSAARPVYPRNDSSQTTSTLSPGPPRIGQQQPSEDPGAFVQTPGTHPAISEYTETNRTPVLEPRAVDEDAQREARSSSFPTPMSSRRPSSGLPNAASFQESHFPSVLVANSAPVYKTSAIPISASTRAVAQQPTYITPPSSPTPIAVNTIYNYTGGPYGPDAVPKPVYVEKQYAPMGFVPPEGKEICVECAMRDEDMADVDVTSPGVWDRESDIYYHDLCRQEADEKERIRTRASNSSSESHAVLRPVDPSRPRAKGHRLTEQNLKFWLSMNPREPQARQQTIDLYIKTQTALLEAEALARARALQESRVLENKLRDTYDSLRRRSAYEPIGVADDGAKIKGSHVSKRSVSGSTPISLVVDGTTNHRKDQSRELTILENGMIVETVDVRKEEKERRREERRERSRARKSSRGSGGAEVTSMYSSHSPLPHQTDFYSTTPNGSGVLRADRPMSLSQASTRAMSASMPLTPPACSPGFGSIRPPNARVHSQISLVDSQSISSTSMAGRRSRFFAFRNWSEAWKSRESFAPSAVMSVSGSMMDMHLALDREKQGMHTRPTTVDFGGSVGAIPSRHSAAWPRRASVSLERPATTEPPRQVKKKGLARIWGFVRGNKGSTSKAEEKRLRESQFSGAPTPPRTEDDAPLAPPPPLSYLVNRSPRERTLSTGTHRNSMVGPTGSGTLPTPTSIRNPWQEHEIARPASRVLTAHPEETSSNGFPADTEPCKPMQAAVSEPNMRQAENGDSRLQAPPMPGRAVSAPRPISVYSLHKSLPPLPPDVSSSMPSPAESLRPKTMYDLESPIGNDNPNMFPEPQSSFTRDVRRSSFGGTGSRPPLPSTGTFPLSAGRNGGPLVQEAYDAYLPYAELGVTSLPAARSLARPSADEKSIGAGTVGSERTVGKRRSRFGLVGLVERITGKSGDAKNQQGSAQASTTQMQMHAQAQSGSFGNLNGWSDARGASYVSDVSAAALLQSESDLHSQSLSGSGSSRSRDEREMMVQQQQQQQQRQAMGALPAGAGQSRMSVASRRAIEELVDQDPNFVAYRYPSVDQNIALLR